MQEERIEGFRLSPQQRQLWLLQRAEAADAAPDLLISPYTSAATVLITGTLDKERLRLALQQVIDEHEILRTSVHAMEGMSLPVQVIADSYTPVLHELDLAGLALENALRELNDQSASVTGAGQGMAFLLATLNPDMHLLKIVLPALCSDSHSLPLFVEALFNAYSANTGTLSSTFTEGEEDEESLQYADIAQWLNDLLEPDDGEEIEPPYWQSFDFGAGLSMRLPAEIETGAQRTVSQPFDPRRVTAPLDPSLLADAERFAAAHDCTVSDLLLLCWSILIWRYRSDADPLLGIVNDGRPYAELQSALGRLATTTPLSLHLRQEDTFQGLLEQLAEQLEEAVESQLYFRWEQLIEPPTTDRALFFPYVFAVEEPLPAFGDATTTFALLELSGHSDRFKLKLSFVTGAEGGSIALAYDPAFYVQAEVMRLAGQLEKLLRSALQQPALAIDRLDLLSEEERRYLLVDFNATEKAYPKEHCFHQLFETQAARTPEQIALICDGENMSYAQLNAHANQVAHLLQQSGVGPDSIVGLAVERSFAMVIGLLAIVKAGGAYLPLDPAYPHERLAFMLEDAEAEILLTQEDLLPTFDGYPGRILCIDRDAPDIQAHHADDLPASATAENLVYVLYTSGSTGKPKGTMITHRGLVNYLTWAIENYDVAGGQGSLVHSPLGFDLTVTSLLAPLLAGRSVILSTTAGIEPLIEGLQTTDASFSLLKLTPSHLTMLEQLLRMEEGEQPLKAQVNALVIGGEALWGENLAFWQSIAPNMRLINEYGPTETVVGCCVYEAPAGKAISGSVPIGRPIANTRLYVLDRHLQPTPVGAPGELYVGGDGVARGYLNRPQLSAASFVDDPFRPAQAARMYRTGDLVRHVRVSAEGHFDTILEFLGRVDDQVKLRGYRIELGEIEAVLTAHPAVQEAAVIVREESSDNQQLVAYVVCRSPATTAQAADAPQMPTDAIRETLHTHLRRTLPDYMWPNQVLLLDRLPLTANGKVDRTALPAQDSRESAVEFVAPRSEAEVELAAIWQDVLKRPQISVHANFFELGGHSLLATQVLSRAQRVLQVKLPIHAMFEEPTIAAMAAIVEQNRRASKLLQTQSQIETSEFDEEGEI